MSIETINISEIGWQWVRAYKVLLSVFQSSQARYLHSICGERSREWSGLLWRLRPEISLPIRERSQSRIALPRPVSFSVVGRLPTDVIRSLTLRPAVVRILLSESSGNVPCACTFRLAGDEIARALRPGVRGVTRRTLRQGGRSKKQPDDDKRK